MGDLTTLERHDEWAVLTLHRPEKKNALSIALRDEITERLGALGSDETLKCLVVTGAGDHFSAGFDLTEFGRAAEDEEFAATLWASSDAYHQAVLRFPLPTIAAVNGPALAGGFDLAVLCDVRVATSTARFAHPEFVFSEVVYGPLHDLVGAAWAREICLTGRALSAEEALGAHLVTQVVAPDALEAAYTEIAERTCAAPRAALVRTKAKALQRAGVAGGPTLQL